MSTFDCLDVGKNKKLRGTWRDSAFQLDMRTSNSPPEDPLPIPLFSEMHPYHCVPHCGVYGVSEYHLSLPSVLVPLSVGNLLQPSSGLPTHFLETIELHHSHGDPLDVFFLIHSCPSFTSAMDPNSRHVNFLFHLWALQGLDLHMKYEEIHTELHVGGFSPVGVAETPPICEAEELNGLPLGHMGTRILYMHEGQLSPNNAQVMLSLDHSLHSLFTFARSEELKRAVLSLHLIPSTQEVEESMLAKASTLKELLHNIEFTDQTKSKLHFNACQKFIYSACSL